MRLLALLPTLITLLPLQTEAQDISRDPYYGELDLVSGFSNDPRTQVVMAGGSIELAESETLSCMGFIGEPPDYRINYSEGSDEYQLSFFATAEVDTVIVVNDPLGAWHCNDDFSDKYGTTAGVQFDSPSYGIYDVWTGVYSEDDNYTEATLYITEQGNVLDQVLEGRGTPAETSSPQPPRNTGSGTAFVITSAGHLLTNHHVVEGCTSLTFQLPGEEPIQASVVSTNQDFDLALLRANVAVQPAEFHSQSRLRLGAEIVVYGFPLLGDLSSQGNLTSGVVSALTGLNDDLSTFQISAQIQPGNSGGPVFDRAGALVGVVVSTANDEYFSAQTGNVPQNVNFAITAGITQAFLDANGVKYTQATTNEVRSIADIAEKAQSITGAVLCYR